MELGERIAYYRKKKKLTQEELAYYLNVSRQTVYKWEASLSKPKLDKLRRIIRLLDITYDDLLD